MLKVVLTVVLVVFIVDSFCALLENGLLRHFNYYKTESLVDLKHYLTDRLTVVKHTAECPNNYSRSVRKIECMGICNAKPGLSLIRAVLTYPSD